jgi:YVTN family beta-propeller protein
VALAGQPMRITPSSYRWVAVAGLWLAAAAAHGQSFVHFESPHVHPVDLTPDRSRLLVVNTVDGRLEVFDVLPSSPYLRRSGSVAVGVEPVSVRARSATEAWVVNHLSDSVSVVDLASMSVRASVLTGDEPADVVFAGSPQRAFVSVSQRNRIEVFNPADLLAAPAIVPVAGEDPRALATDGTRVYAAIFECGNDTTVIPDEEVSNPNLSPYPGVPNPPPNASGGAFSPPLAAGLPLPPRASLIVRKDSAGQWRDDRGGNWSFAVGWDLSGNDVAVVSAASLAVSYAKGFMTVPMAVAVAGDGRLVTVGTELTNHVRFEPNLRSTFVRVEAAVLQPGGALATSRFDLNPHLDYSQRTAPESVRALSVGDPRGIALSADGTRGFATGLGSNNVIAFAVSGGARVATCAVGEGPTGIVLDPVARLLFVLNRFEGTVSVVDEQSFQEVARMGFFDPTPPVVHAGRAFLFDTHLSSGLGQASCASCHIDARMDQLAWDLGDPSGAMTPASSSCNTPVGSGFGACEPPHPMKGPMVTQTLVGLQGEEPFHWRGDRSTIEEFGHTAQALLGADADFTPTEMQRLAAYLETISFPPNPNRNLDGSLRTLLDGGNAVTGESLFRTAPIDQGSLQCVRCHTFPNGSGASVISANLLREPQSMTIAHLRNMYEKTGFDRAPGASSARGFGFLHDGVVASMLDFLRLQVFTFPGGAAGEQQRRDLAAFMMSWDTGTHASVGAQATVGGPASNGTARRNQLVAIAGQGHAELVAKAPIDGIERGFLFRPALGTFDADLSGEIWTLASLDALSATGVPVTYTLLPKGTGLRAIDRDNDGFRDGDERDACSDPADPTSTPNAGCRSDIAADDGVVSGADLGVLLGNWGLPGIGDLNCDGAVTGSDLGILLGDWGPCP